MLKHVATKQSCKAQQKGWKENTVQPPTMHASEISRPGGTFDMGDDEPQGVEFQIMPIYVVSDYRLMCVWFLLEQEAHSEAHSEGGSHHEAAKDQPVPHRPSMEIHDERGKDPCTFS